MIHGGHGVVRKKRKRYFAKEIMCRDVTHPKKLIVFSRMSSSREEMAVAFFFGFRDPLPAVFLGDVRDPRKHAVRRRPNGRRMSEVSLHAGGPQAGFRP